MIASYNRLQILKGLFLLAASIVCYAIAWMFFRYGLAFVFHSFRLPATLVPWLSLAALGAVTYGGWRQWQRGDGFNSYLESSLFHDLGNSGGAFLVEEQTHRVTGSAYLLSQIFLGGPLLALRALKHLRQRLPTKEGLETRLHETLSLLQIANKWQSIEDHPDRRLEILMLAQMRKIDFSTHTGIMRIKALPAHGV
jgi:hypothetical protein